MLSVRSTEPFHLTLANRNFTIKKKKLAEMEEKYKKHAIYQTQFENDNQKLLYEVDILKDLIEEHEELIIELRRQFKEKSRVTLIDFLGLFFKQK